jgi:chaperonin GroES
VGHVYSALALKTFECQILISAPFRGFAVERPMKFKPLNDRVLIKRTASETKTAGGLFIPENAKEKPSEGEVIAVGEGRHLENGKVRALEVKKGDKVFFKKWSGSEVTIEGVEHTILREDEILAVWG